MSNASNRPINFSWNWNGQLFSRWILTIRPHNPGKYQVGNRHDIQLNQRDIGQGIIREIDVFRLSQLTNKIAGISMGLCLEKAKATLLTMYKNKGFDWEKQEFDLLLIEMPEKIMLPFPDELFGRYVDEESEEGQEYLRSIGKGEGQ